MKTFIFSLLALFSMNVSAQIDFQRLQDDYIDQKYDKVLITSEKKLSREWLIYVLTYKAYAASSLGKIKLALEKIKQLEEMKVKNEELSHLRAYLFIKSNQFEKAISDFKEIEAKGALRNDEKMTLLNIYLQLHRFNEAYNLIETFSDNFKTSFSIL